jgi:hypothetical protein
MDDQRLSYKDFVLLVISALDDAGVPYLIGGAVAAWAWGEPRSTMDLDLVVDIPLEAIHRLSNELEKRGMLVPAEIILDNIIEERADIPINAIHMHSGFKADLYLVREGDELRASAFARRQKVDLGEGLGELYLHSPEDLIIYKVWYYSLSQQTKHANDISGILKALGTDLDYRYIEDWLNKKGLSSWWNEILALIRTEK